MQMSIVYNWPIYQLKWKREKRALQKAIENRMSNKENVVVIVKRAIREETLVENQKDTNANH